MDEGFVYKDRKIVKKDEEENKRRIPEVDMYVNKYRDRIKACIDDKKLFELEKILNELTLTLVDDADSLQVYKEVRMSIIHGQIMLANFFKWKREVKERQVELANKNFKLALIADAKKEARAAAIAQLDEMSSPLKSKRKNAAEKLAPLTARKNLDDQGESTIRTIPGDVDQLMASTQDGTQDCSKIQDSLSSVGLEETQRNEEKETGLSATERLMQIENMLQAPETLDEIDAQMKYLKQIIDNNIKTHKMRR